MLFFQSVLYAKTWPDSSMALLQHKIENNLKKHKVEMQRNVMFLAYFGLQKCTVSTSIVGIGLF